MAIRNFSLGNRFVDNGIHTLIVAVVATVIGLVLEKFFSNKSDTWAIPQVVLIGMIYEFVKGQFQPNPNSWVVFAACLFYMQPSLLSKFKRMFGSMLNL